jgi:nitric oxide reductase NorE protein
MPSETSRIENWQTASQFRILFTPEVGRHLQMVNSVATAGVDSQPVSKSVERSSFLPGDPSMWFFVIGDLIIFGVYFVCYMLYRGRDHATFLTSQQHLNQGIGVINTLILLTSSLLVALGTTSAREGRTVDAKRYVSAAAAVGALFPLLKMFEWIPDISAGLTPGTNLFFMFYYVMTGLHLVHVLVGLTLMGFVINRLRSPEAPVRFVETAGLYWHMVDVLWLILFATFYLMR